MREIKFRVWDKEHKAMGYLGLFNEGYHIPDVGTGYDDESPIMQFTGLKDKNGKEIYEGDILEIGNTLYEGEKGVPYLGSPFVCEYKEFFFGLRALNDPEERVCTGPWPGEHSYHVVIGNIYENPELVKK